VETNQPVPQPEAGLRGAATRPRRAPQSPRNPDPIPSGEHREPRAIVPTASPHRPCVVPANRGLTAAASLAYATPVISERTWTNRVLLAIAAAVAAAVAGCSVSGHLRIDVTGTPPASGCLAAGEHAPCTPVENQP
jgi:hypothetical protein